jgi:AraC-like DNA-binding protein
MPGSDALAVTSRTPALEVAAGLEDCLVWRPSTLPESVEITAAAPRWRQFPLRLSTTLGLCLKLGEPHVAVSDGAHLSIPPEVIILRPPGCTWAALPGRVGFLAIDLAADELPPDATFGAMTCIPAAELPSFHHALQVLRHARSRGAQSGAVAELVQALLERGFIRSEAGGVTASDGAGGASGPAAGTAAVRRARDFLHSHLDRNVSLAELAAHCGENRFVLLRRFRRVVGMPPHAFQLQLRLQAARDLLARGMPPTEVTFRTGFADQSHFGRRFKRLVGLTPHQYARQVRSVFPLASPSPLRGAGEKGTRGVTPPDRCGRWTPRRSAG